MSAVATKSPTNEYTSPYGYVINLPLGWDKLQDASPAALTSFKPELFACDEDWSLSISWSRIRVPSYEAMDELSALCTFLGVVPAPDADAVVSRLVPLVGVTTKAQVIGLPTGERAIEIIKAVSFSDNEPHRFGMDLLIDPQPRPFRFLNDSQTLYVDRVSFYADSTRFQTLFPQIKQCLHSIRYMR